MNTAKLYHWVFLRYYSTTRRYCFYITQEKSTYSKFYVNEDSYLLITGAVVKTWRTNRDPYFHGVFIRDKRNEILARVSYIAEIEYYFQEKRNRMFTPIRNFYN